MNTAPSSEYSSVESISIVSNSSVRSSLGKNTNMTFPEDLYEVIFSYFRYDDWKTRDNFSRVSKKCNLIAKLNCTDNVTSLLREHVREICKKKNSCRFFYSPVFGKSGKQASSSETVNVSDEYFGYILEEEKISNSEKLQGKIPQIIRLMINSFSDIGSHFSCSYKFKETNLGLTSNLRHYKMKFETIDYKVSLAKKIAGKFHVKNLVTIQYLFSKTKDLIESKIIEKSLASSKKTN